MKRLSLLICIGLLWLVAIQPFIALGEATTSIELKVKDVQVAADQEVEVTVVGSGLQDLFGFEIRLKYDSDKMRFLRASTPWKGMSVPVKDTDGTVMFAHTKLGSTTKGEDGTAELAVFTFTGLAEGHTTIEIEKVKLVNSKAEAVTSSAGKELALVVGKTVFSDINNHWARQDIEQAVTMGIVSGYPDGTFRPDGKVTRAEFTAMLLRAISVPEADGAALAFADVQSIPEWARSFVSKAVKVGIISGYEDGTFRSDQSITRAEMAVMIAKTSGLSENENIPGFADVDEIPGWARSSIAGAVAKGLLQGKGENRFEPLSHATRAEAVSLILRLAALQQR
jgi:hypothetical protein